MGATSLKQLKQAREAQSSALRENLTKKNEYATNDERFWRPKTGDDGTAYAVIRFLPPSPGEELPYITMYQYSVKGPGGWYIEKSRQSIGDSDPMNEYSRTLWEDKDSMSDAEKQYARQFNRRITYISNILVLEDPGQPENEGKVFLFGYGSQVMEKIKEKEAPEFKDTKSFNPFDFWDGAPFKLRIRQKDKFPNYEKSSFDPQEALFDGDEDKLEAVWKLQYNLASLLDPTNFKTYDQLQARLNVVLKRGARKASTEEVGNDNPQARKAADDDTPPWEDGESETESTSATSTLERGGARRRGTRKRTDEAAADDEGIGFVRELANR